MITLDDTEKNLNRNGADAMADSSDTTAALDKLARENARLNGEILATGVILAQLLQSICRTQMNPYAFATKIMKDAQDAVRAFEPEGGSAYPAEIKAAALETVKHYDAQIRSVLPV